jgi:tetratricopeptide (TPR) repeat protein
MPGHIYSQTGRWQDATKSFSGAAVNERTWMKQDKLYGDGHHGHNVHYLATAYSFEGRFDDAMEAAREILAMPENPAQKANIDLMTTAHAQGWFATLRALVQFEKWDSILDGQMLPEFGKPRQEAWRHWARALAYANRGDAAAAKEEAAKFEQAMSEFREKTHRPDPPELKVAREEMAGHLAISEGRIGVGIKQLQAASKAERRLTYTEPPYYPRPAAEALGNLALKHHKTSTAEKAFRAALEQYPNDAHAEKGLRAASASPDRKVTGSAGFK